MLIKFIVIRIQPAWFRFTDFCRLIGSYEIQSEIDRPGSSVKPVWKTMAIKSCLTIFIKWKKSFKNLISNSPRSKLKLFYELSIVISRVRRDQVFLSQSRSRSGGNKPVPTPIPRNIRSGSRSRSRLIPIISKFTRNRFHAHVSN
jgi:hypothetical protein